MMTLPESLAEYVSELKEADRQERIEMLIDLAKELPPLPPRFEGAKDDAHRVPECQSPVFLFAEMDGPKVHLFADAPIEAPTVRGFVALLLKGLDGRTREEILAVGPEIIEGSGMAEILGMLRVRGLHGVLERLKWRVARATPSTS